MEKRNIPRFENGAKSAAVYCTQIVYFLGHKSEKEPNLSEKDKRFLNAIFATQKSRFHHGET